MKATTETVHMRQVAEMFSTWARMAKDEEKWELASLYATTAVNYWRRVKWL